jgi:hypothetical protein
MELQIAIGSVATVAGVVGIFISFLIEKSEFDPTAFALSMVSIFIAVVGIALILQQPAKPQEKQRRKHKKN